ncbi:MAG TPA: alpha/beta hydrolase [Dokdonella sp.]
MSAAAMSNRWSRIALCGVLAVAAAASAQESVPKVDAAPTVDAGGAVTSVSARFPFSAFAASPQALERFRQILVEGKAAPGLAGPIEASRKFYDAINADRAARMRKLYPVEITAAKIGGVAVDIVAPVGKSDARRVLINLHGGAFLWGAGSGGLVESIPVANLSAIKVVSVDYRQGPESAFPAASEDVESVYRALLKEHRAQDIGIYGCSAGGILTAEAVAWLASKRLPTPGAIGIFCAGVVDLQGDSAFVGPMLMGENVPTAPMSVGVLPYFKGADVASPLVMPGASPDVLARFPPTLLISGTRDFAMSAVLRSDDLLTQAGVSTELHVWEGMWHSFFSDPELPESKAAYQVMARFFQRHLGHPVRH